MVNPRFPDISLKTPEEVLEEEIQDLERPMLRSWVPWVAGVGALIVLGSALFSLVFWEHGGIVHRMAARYKVPVNLVAPKGVVDGAPRSFEWSAIEGARSYVVTIHGGDGEAVLTRPVERTYLVPTDIERAYLLPGGYEWRVEARGPDGRTLAGGSGRFRISAEGIEVDEAGSTP